MGFWGWRSIRTIQDVVDWNLCVGCGACYYACDEGAVRLAHVENQGVRPRFDESICEACTDCLSICPAVNLDAQLVTGAESESEADHEFGPALEIWEGYASDPEIRHRASSGGLLSALSLYCLERENMDFVLHAGMDEQEPWRNTTTTSRDREGILKRAGSRYAPSSPCEGLEKIENCGGPCVFVGKPCDSAAVSMLRHQKPQLDQNLGLVLTFFCAGTPSTRGTLDLLDRLGVNRAEIDSLHYRGKGWPGRFRVRSKGSDAEKPSLSYKESWSALTGYRPIRCNLCPDGLGRLADLSCGDAWNRHGDDDDPGRSLVLVRTERGRRILHAAREANYVELQRVGDDEVLTAQVNLLARRRQLFGRLLGMRLLCIPVPNFRGFSLWRSWKQLPFTEKIRTVVGTSRRMIQKGLWRRESRRRQV